MVLNWASLKERRQRRRAYMEAFVKARQKRLLGGYSPEAVDALEALEATMQFEEIIAFRRLAARANASVRAPLSLSEAELGKMHDALETDSAESRPKRQGDADGFEQFRISFTAASHPLQVTLYQTYHQPLLTLVINGVESTATLTPGASDLPEIGLSLDILSVHVRDVTRTDALREVLHVELLDHEQKARMSSLSGRESTSDDDEGHASPTGHEECISLRLKVTPDDPNASVYASAAIGYLRCQVNPLLFAPLHRFLHIPPSHFLAASRLEDAMEAALQRESGVGTSIVTSLRQLNVALQNKPASVHLSLAGMQFALLEPPTGDTSVALQGAHGVRKRQVMYVRMLLVMMGEATLASDDCVETKDTGGSPSTSDVPHEHGAPLAVDAAINDVGIAILPPTDVAALGLALPGQVLHAAKAGRLLEPTNIGVRLVARLDNPSPDVPRLEATVSFSAVRFCLREASLRELPPLVGKISMAVIPLTAASKDTGGRSGWVEVTHRSRPHSFEAGRPDLCVVYGRCWAFVRKRRLTYVTSKGKYHHVHLNELEPPQLLPGARSFILVVQESALPGGLRLEATEIRCSSRSEANRWIAACAALQRPRRRSHRRSLAWPTADAQTSAEEVAIGDRQRVQLAASVQFPEVCVYVPDETLPAAPFGSGRASPRRDTLSEMSGDHSPQHDALNLRLLGLSVNLRLRPMDVDLGLQLIALVVVSEGEADAEPASLLDGGRIALASASASELSAACKLDGYGAEGGADDALLVCGLRFVQDGSPVYDAAAAEICFEGRLRPLQVHVEPHALLGLLAVFEDFNAAIESISVVLNALASSLSEAMIALSEITGMNSSASFVRRISADGLGRGGMGAAEPGTTEEKPMVLWLLQVTRVTLLLHGRGGSGVALLEATVDDLVVRGVLAATKEAMAGEEACTGFDVRATLRSIDAIGRESTHAHSEPRPIIRTLVDEREVSSARPMSVAPISNDTLIAEHGFGGERLDVQVVHEYLMAGTLDVAEEQRARHATQGITSEPPVVETGRSARSGDGGGPAPPAAHTAHALGATCNQRGHGAEFGGSPAANPSDRRHAGGMRARARTRRGDGCGTTERDRLPECSDTYRLAPRRLHRKCWERRDAQRPVCRIFRFHARARRGLSATAVDPAVRRTQPADHCGAAVIVPRPCPRPAAGLIAGDQ